VPPERVLDRGVVLGDLLVAAARGLDVLSGLVLGHVGAGAGAVLHAERAAAGSDAGGGVGRARGQAAREHDAGEPRGEARRCLHGRSFKPPKPWRLLERPGELRDVARNRAGAPWLCLCAAMPADIPSRRWSTIPMTTWTPSEAVFHR